MPKKSVDLDLIKRFSAVFKDSGLSQAAFGKRIGQEQHAISQVLSGTREPSKGMLRRVIEEFDVYPEWMLSSIGSMRKPEEKPTGYVSREELAEVRGGLQAELRILRESMEKIAEALRAHSLQGPGESHLPGRSR